MAVSSATAWEDSTAIAATTSAATLKSIRATLNPAATATSYLQVFDAAATPGVTAPVLVLPFPAFTGNRTVAVPFPGGLRFGTALQWVVTTTHDGATAATTSAPLRVDVHYTP